MKQLPAFTCKHCQKHHNDGHPEPVPSDLTDALQKAQDEIVNLKYNLVNQIPIIQYMPVAPYPWDEPKKEPPTPPEKSTDLIVGYRVWIYKDGYLTSAFKTNVKWPHRKMLVRDVYDNAGIHACKEYKKCLQLLKEYCDDTPSMYNPMGINRHLIGVAGAVYMWGEVKEHETGYLSEFAYPKELYVGDDFDPISAMQLEENYGVSVQLREELTKENISKVPIENIWRTAAMQFFTYVSPWSGPPLKSSIP